MNPKNRGESNFLLFMAGSSEILRTGMTAGMQGRGKLKKVYFANYVTSFAWHTAIKVLGIP